MILTGKILWYCKIDKNGIIESEDKKRRYFDSNHEFKKGQIVTFVPTPWLDSDKFCIHVELKRAK